MTLFHELYGIYFRITGKLLSHRQLTEQEVRKTIQKDGFRDSVLVLPKKLLPQKDGSDWGLLRRTKDGTLTPVTKHPPQPLLTTLQKRWLQACLDDPRMALFLNEAERTQLRERLHVKPLFSASQMHITDQYTDGDHYADEHCQQIFRQLTEAVRKQEILHIRYLSGRGRRLRIRCVPVKLEYSERNDKFRVYCMDLRGKRSGGSLILNLGRICSVQNTGEFRDPPIPEERIFRKLRCKEPVTVCVIPERNAVERFLMEFASYEKRTERDTGTGCCTVRLWYDRQDETELLIRLLSYGPMLKILAPPDFRKKAAERVQKQYTLLVQ